jgi:hypothetical protein
MSCICANPSTVSSEWGSIGGRKNFRVDYCGSPFCLAIHRYLKNNTDAHGEVSVAVVQRCQRVAAQIRARYLAKHPDLVKRLNAQAIADERRSYRNRVADLLEEMARDVRMGDSFEGTFAYEMQRDGSFKVRAAYRVGNLQGQGGMRLIEEPSEPEPAREI